jgi:hypothetical protein
MVPPVWPGTCFELWESIVDRLRTGIFWAGAARVNHGVVRPFGRLEALRGRRAACVREVAK